MQKLVDKLKSRVDIITKGGGEKAVSRHTSKGKYVWAALYFAISNIVYFNLTPKASPFLKKRLITTRFIKFIYSEKATKFCEIFTLFLTVYTVVKSKVKILQSFVAFSEYMNLTRGMYIFYPIFRCGL